MERVSPERKRQYEIAIQSIFKQYIDEYHNGQIQVDSVDLALEKKSYANVTFSSNQKSILETFESSYSGSDYSRTIQFQSTRYSNNYASHLLTCYCVYDEEEVYHHAYGEDIQRQPPPQQLGFNNYNQGHMSSGFRSPPQQHHGFRSSHHHGQIPPRRFVAPSRGLSNECKNFLIWVGIFVAIILVVWFALK